MPSMHVFIWASSKHPWLCSTTYTAPEPSIPSAINTAAMNWKKKMKKNTKKLKLLSLLEIKKQKTSNTIYSTIIQLLLLQL